MDAAAVHRLFFDLGADVCGIAAVGRFAGAPAGFHPRDLYDRCQSVIVFGKALPRGVLRVPPRHLYLNAMHVCLSALDRLSLTGSMEIERRGGAAVPFPSDAPYEYWDAERSTARGLLSLKHAAVLAGLGELGKSTLLLHPEHGNRLMLGGVLTDQELEPDPVRPTSLCPPGCRICEATCPQQAIGSGTVDQSRCRKLVYGVNAKGFPICNCNLCRRSCPHART